MKVKMRFANMSAMLLLHVVAMPAVAMCAAPISGSETWLELMGGNVRKDGLRMDLEAIRDAGISGVQFFHIGDRAGKDQKGSMVWPGCEKTQTPCLSAGWDDLVSFLGEECKRLGLALTVQNCPGWSQSGGPWIDLDHCQRDIRMARRDFVGGEEYRLLEIPARYRDVHSDWRDVCVLAFPTPEGDSEDSVLKPEKVEKEGENRIFYFAAPVTVRSLVLPGINKWNSSYAYEMPWMRVALDVKAAHGWKEVVRSPLPTTSWRDYVETYTLSCGEDTGSTWRFRFEHDLPIKNYCEPKLCSAPRMTDWESRSARTLRSLPRESSPPQGTGCFIDPAKIVDLTGRQKWTVPLGCWTVVRFGHVNSKHVNAPAPKEATGWECDKLDPAGREAHFKGYVGRLNDGPLKGKMRAMVVDSWECFCQTWTPKMETYFREANGYDLRRWMPALFGWIVDSPDATDRFLTDWRRTNGDLITRNYYGRMAELAHEAGLEVYYETAFGDIIHGDLLEYWKYADAPMCEFWYPHKDRFDGGCCWYQFKPIRPCASAAHIYGKRRVIAESFTGSGIQWDEDFRKMQDDANRHFARGVTHLVFHNYTHAPVPDATPPGGCMGGFNGTPFTRLQTWWKQMPEFTAWISRCEEMLEAGQPVQDVLWYLGDAVDHKPDEMYPFPEGFRADYLNHDVLTNRLVVKDGAFTIPEGAEWKVLWVPDERYMLPATRVALKRLSDAGGKVVFGGKDALVKALADIQRDVATDPALGDEPSEDFMWIHRKEDGIERYFVAAGTNGWHGKATFRANGTASIFDPVSLERTAWHNGDVLDIPPSRSFFVEFFGGNVEMCNCENVKAANTQFHNSTITNWTLSFPPGWGAPEKVALEHPVSWTEIPGFSREARAFGGTAVYETTFECSAGDAHHELDLGRVESIAKVFINGKHVRTLWCEPYRCCLDGFVRRGKNNLRIEVTNTWRNRIVYDLGLPEKARKTWIIYKQRYNPGPTDPFIPSGLLGPVLLKGH